MMLSCITGFQVTFDCGVVVFFKSGGLPPSTQGTGLCFKQALSLSAGCGFTCNASLSLLDSGVMQPAASAVFISTWGITSPGLHKLPIGETCNFNNDRILGGV